MSRSSATSVLIILIAALLGAALAVGLYEWEFLARGGIGQADPTSGSKSLEQQPEIVPRVQGFGSPAGATAGPVSSTGSKDTSDGARVYASSCAACHPGGKAGVGPALRGQAFASRFADDDSLRKLTREGKGGMPPFPAAAISDTDLDALVAYIRSLK